MPLTPDSILHGRYRIISILGQGGMGAVYRAEDVHLHTPVAVKENLFLTSEYSRQFQREATIMARLRHHHLPRVRDFFDSPGQGQYLVMDFIEGEDLRQRIERIGTISEVDTILIGVAICDALQYLHTRVPPIIHRDIKPGNIKITPDGEVYLVDFGLAKMVMGDQATTTGARAMTPGYSPPEQYGTARTDARSDIYSLGATLYAALTGKIPEDGLTRATEKALLTPIKRHLPRINPELAEIIERALEVDSEDRYQSADDMRRDLLEAGEMTNLFLTPPTITAPPDFSIPPVEEVLPSMNSSNSNKSATGRNTRKRLTRMWKRNRVAILSTASVFIAIIILLFAFQPKLNPPAAAILASPTQTRSEIIFSPTLETTPTLQEVTATWTLEPPPTQEPVTPTPLVAGSNPGTDQPQIMFASNRTGIPQLWLMNSDGTNQVQMTNLPDGACKPSWAPDGMQVAFISPCMEDRDIYEGSRIYILDLHDLTVRPLAVDPSPEGDFDPAWSPDGKRIAFASKRSGVIQIYAFNLETGALKQLTKTSVTEIQPAWSTNGSQIAYVHWIVYSQIWVMSDTGQSNTQFSMSGEINNFWPVWSRSNDRIFFGQKQSSAPLTYITTMKFEDRGTYTSTKIPSRSPASGAQPITEISISPDGEWFSFKSWPDGTNHDIYIMDINGANWSRLTTDPAYDFSPAWRPQSSN